MEKNKPDEFKRAQIMGELKTMPDVQQTVVEQKEEQKPVETMDEFRQAIWEIQTSSDLKADEKFITVSDKVFDLIVKKREHIKMITYDNPGVKVYRQGAKKELDLIDSLTAEQYHNYKSKGSY